MPYTWVWWWKGRELTYPIRTSPHTLSTILHAYHPSTYPLQIPHISLLCTVRDTKTFLTQQKRNLSGLGLSIYQPVRKIPTTYFPPFSNICPRLPDGAQWTHDFWARWLQICHRKSEYNQKVYRMCIIWWDFHHYCHLLRRYRWLSCTHTGLTAQRYSSASNDVCRSRQRATRHTVKLHKHSWLQSCIAPNLYGVSPTMLISSESI